MGAGQGLGDREWGEPDTEMESFDDKLDTELGETAILVESGAAS